MDDVLCMLLRLMKNLNGARRSIIEKPLEYIQLIRIQWQSPQVNHRELALLRFTQGKTERELAKHLIDPRPPSMNCWPG
jgi:hypothetical protein